MVRRLNNANLKTSIENNNKNQEDLPKKKTVKRVITYKIK